MPSRNNWKLTLFLKCLGSSLRIQLWKALSLKQQNACFACVVERLVNLFQIELLPGLLNLPSTLPLEPRLIIPSLTVHLNSWVSLQCLGLQQPSGWTPESNLNLACPPHNDISSIGDLVQSMAVRSAWTISQSCWVEPKITHVSKEHPNNAWRDGFFGSESGRQWMESDMNQQQADVNVQLWRLGLALSHTCAVLGIQPQNFRAN